jgi:hypothetical protein
MVSQCFRSTPTTRTGRTADNITDWALKQFQEKYGAGFQARRFTTFSVLTTRYRAYKENQRDAAHSPL